jgi:PAS domain S-box-containing protein
LTQILEEEKEWLRVTLRSIGDAVIVADRKGKVIFLNKVAEELTGWTMSDATGKLVEDVFNVIHEKTRMPIKTPFDSAIKLGQTVWLANHAVLCSRNGKEYCVADSCAPIVDAGGKTIGVVLVFRDVSNERKTQEVLNRLATAVEQSADGIAMADMESRIIYCNKAWLKMHGYTKEETAGSMIATYHTDQQLVEEVLPLNEIVLKEGLHSGEMGHKRKDGSTFPTYMTVSLMRDNEGLPVGMVAIAHDITDHKKAEAALRDSENKFSTAFRANPEMLILSEAETGRILEVNDSFLKIFGFSLDETIGKTSFELGIWPSAADRMRLLVAVRDGRGEVRNLASINRKKNGELFPVLISTDIIKIGGRERMLSVVRDMTDIKKAEKEIKLSQMKYEMIFNTVPSMVVMMTPDGKIVEANREFMALTEFTEDEIKNRTFSELSLLDGSKKWQEILERIFVEKWVNGEEISLKTRSGSLRHLLFSARLMTIEGKTFMLGVANDISELKKLNERLIASLGEKEILIKEIHHRVKNNLQVISSLLSLQSRFIDNDKIKTLLCESQERIRVMAMIHESLYRSSDFSSIPFADYVNGLVADIVRIYCQNSEKIRLNIKVDQIWLKIEQAIPAALIINELVVNAIKHGFNDIFSNPDSQASGELEIIMKQEGDFYQLSICNSGGNPFPLEIDFKSSNSLGLQLVNVLTRQLEGDINLFHQDGTLFVIRFPAK